MVRLLQGMALQFLNAVIYFAEQIFKASVVDLDKEEANNFVGLVSVASGSSVVLPLALSGPQVLGKTIEERMTEVMADIEEKGPMTICFLLESERN